MYIIELGVINVEELLSRREAMAGSAEVNSRLRRSGYFSVGEAESLAAFSSGSVNKSGIIGVMHV